MRRTVPPIARSRSRARPPVSSTRAAIAISWRRKSTSSPTSSATRIAHYLDPVARARCACARKALRDALAKATRLTISACGTAYLCRPRRQILVRDDCAAGRRSRCRVGTALSRRRSIPKAARRSSFRNRARRPTRWRRCATRRQQGQTTIAIVNVPESSIAREADIVLPTFAGPEIGVASTKAFTCQLAVLASLRHRGGPRARRI